MFKCADRVLAAASFTKRLAGLALFGIPMIVKEAAYELVSPDSNKSFTGVAIMAASTVLLTIFPDKPADQKKSSSQSTSAKDAERSA